MPSLLGMRELAAKLKKRQERAISSFKKNLRSHGAIYLRIMKMRPGQDIKYKQHTIVHNFDGTYSVVLTRYKGMGLSGKSGLTAMGAANYLFPEGEFISTLREETGR